MAAGGGGSWGLWPDIHAGLNLLAVLLVLATLRRWWDGIPPSPNPLSQAPAELVFSAPGDVADSDRALAMAVEAVAVDNTVVLSIVNKGYLDFCENWFKSISRLGFGDRVLLFAEDHEGFRYIEARWPGHAIEYNYTRMPHAEAHSQDFGSRGFFLMTQRRPDYLKAVLRLGVNVLYNDLDMSWLRNPFPALVGDYDVWVNDDWTDYTSIDTVRPMIKDTVFPSRYHPNICSCLLFLRPTSQSLLLLERWQYIMDTTQWKPPMQDQPFFNKALNALPDLKVGILPQRLFPSGCHFFQDSLWRQAVGHSAMLVHNNWVVGHEVKKLRFQEAGIWLVAKNKTKTAGDRT